MIADGLLEACRHLRKPWSGRRRLPNNTSQMPAGTSIAAESWPKDGVTRTIRHLVLASESFDFTQAEYVAIGMAEVSGPPFWSKIWTRLFRRRASRATAAREINHSYRLTIDRLPRLTIHRHPRITASLAPPVSNAWRIGQGVNFEHAMDLTAARALRNHYALRRRSIRYIGQRHIHLGTGMVTLRQLN